MIVYSLTGKSGTGKSYQAIELCRDRKIDAIIDDGLFVYKGRVEAGTSAKLEKTKIGATKAAIFTHEEPRARVAARIHEINPQTILVIGTSDDMADIICERLDLPPVSERIHIEDITTEEEREIAQHSRGALGKHVVPVTTFQLKHDFAGYFREPLALFRGSRSGRSGRRYGEKTVVRPTYSYMGDFYLSDGVIEDIARCVAEESDGIAEIRKFHENMAPDALVLTALISMRRGPGLIEKAEAFQKALVRQVSDMTAFNVVKADVQIQAVVDR